MSTTETFNSGSTLSEMFCSMAGYCNQNGKLGPTNVSLSVHPEAKVVNHNVVSIEKDNLAWTSSPFQEVHPPIFAYHPKFWVYWVESVVISPGLARSLRYESLDCGPSPTLIWPNVRPHQALNNQHRDKIFATVAF
jgi:hypothetical protein